MRPEWKETGAQAWHCPLSRQQGVPELTQLRRRKQHVCTHPNTAACCVHHVHTQARTQTHTETDTCTHASTQGHTCAHHTHPYTGTHPYTCPTCGQEERTNHPPANTCRHRHTQCGDTAPTSTGFFQLVETLSHLPVGPSLLILQTSERQAPLDHDLLCFLGRRLPANLGALELSVPRPPLSLAWGGLSRGHRRPSGHIF